jgi:seryl-tRNA synthetase
MFIYTTLDDSYAAHEQLLSYERQWLLDLELPFRVIDVAAGDLGLSAIRKFDCEAWVPTQDRYREVTSTSNCTQFQARRLDIRTRDGGSTQAAATLNGTLCAVPRTIVALLENHQQPDGSVYVPLALRPYLQGQDVLKPVGSGA